MHTEQKALSYIHFSEVVGNLCYLNDTERERSIRIGDKYIKALFLYSNDIFDINNIILSYLNWIIKIGDLMDVKDYWGHWYCSVITKIKNEKVFVHYIGWANRWDEWVDISRITLKGRKTDGLFKRYGNTNYECIYHHLIIDRLNLSFISSDNIYIQDDGKIIIGKINNFTVTILLNLSSQQTNRTIINNINYTDDRDILKNISNFTIISFANSSTEIFLFVTIND